MGICILLFTGICKNNTKQALPWWWSIYTNTGIYDLSVQQLLTQTPSKSYLHDSNNIDMPSPLGRNFAVPLSENNMIITCIEQSTIAYNQMAWRMSYSNWKDHQADNYQNCKIKRLCILPFFFFFFFYENIVTNNYISKIWCPPGGGWDYLLSVVALQVSC